MEVASVSARLSLRRVWVLAGASVGRITQRMNGWRTLRTGRACPCGGFWISAGASVGRGGRRDARQSLPQFLEVLRTGWTFPCADSGVRWDATRIQGNAAARKVNAFAWARGIGFRTGRAGVSSWLPMRAGKTVLLMRRCLLSMQGDFGDCGGRAILSTRRSSQAGAGHWWTGAAFYSNPFLRASNPARDCVIGDGRVPMRLGRVVQSVP
jgi:hypothetical protein